jgi:hypothetical protein
MATVPRLAEHVHDIAGRLSDLLVALSELEIAPASGATFDVATLRPSLERALENTAGLLVEIQRTDA